VFTRRERGKIFSSGKIQTGKCKGRYSVYFDVIMAGFGGQGIQIISQIMVESAINRGLEVTYLPSYGVEKRGGRTNVIVVVSDEEIGSPITNHPLSVIAMDAIALEKYQPQVIPNGILIANTSLISESLVNRGDIDALKIKCNDEAIALGDPKFANMIAFGALVEKIDFLDLNEITKVIENVVPERLKDTIPKNLKAIERGMEIVRG
jgi:2-oxoglutarate ferredoxin oxidoreductase subunit gamma